MSPNTYRFRVHAERLAIARLPPDTPLPRWPEGGIVTISRTTDELSIVCAQRLVPAHVEQKREMVGLGIEGVIPMTTIGLLAHLCAALAAARVPVFVISTYDTDWLLVSAEHFAAAKSALEELGHEVSGALPAH